MADDQLGIFNFILQQEKMLDQVSEHIAQELKNSLFCLMMWGATPHIT